MSAIPLFQYNKGIADFRNIVSDHNAESLFYWMNAVRDSGIGELISFVNGLERDYTAVINAIQLPYSNGLADGKINKLKVIKRIMYGRCNFDALRSKILQLEYLNKIN